MNWGCDVGETHQDAAETILRLIDVLNLHLHFGVFISAVTTCGKCQIQSEASAEHESFLLLNVSQREQRMADLVFEYQQNRHYVDYTCSACQSTGCDSYRKYSIILPSRWVIIQLLRFDRSQRKIATPVGVCLELRLGRNPNPHSLRGVVIHHGDTMDSGHYTFLRRMAGDLVSWHHFNDDRPVQIMTHEQAESLISNGYIYLYGDIDTTDDEATLDATAAIMKILHDAPAVAIARALEIVRMPRECLIHSALVRNVTSDAIKRILLQQCLCDEGMNGSINVINAVLRETSPRSRFLSTFFWTMFQSDPERALRRWKDIGMGTAVIDWRMYERIVIPIHFQRNHWMFIALDFGNRSYALVDSLKAQHHNEIDKVNRFIEYLSLNGFQDFIGQLPWQQRIMGFDFEKQNNDVDCGLFVLALAMQFLRNDFRYMSCEAINRFRADVLVMLLSPAHS
jgi:hypothetical protein